MNRSALYGWPASGTSSCDATIAEAASPSDAATSIAPRRHTSNCTTSMRPDVPGPPSPGRGRISRSITSDPARSARPRPAMVIRRPGPVVSSNARPFQPSPWPVITTQ